MPVQIPTAAVIGQPVGHSLSPSIHQHWLHELGMAGDYLAHEVAPENLREAVIKYAGEGYRGLNATIPHKEPALQLCDEVTRAAKEIGAVNTLIFKANKIMGDNTDAAGFAEHLTHEILNPTLTHATLIGAGGAARAIVFALKGLGVQSFAIVNRNLQRADRLLAELQVRGTVHPHDSRIPPGTSILVNCTSLGMQGQPPLEIGLSGLLPETIIADVVYRPLRTELLRTAAARGHQTVDGLGMLIHQAALAFEQFYGVRPRIKPGLRNLLEMELSAP